MRAIVVFGDGGWRWLWPLRRGFRHCWVIFDGGLAVEPLLHRTHVCVVDVAAVTGAVVAVDTRPVVWRDSMLPMTCVGVVKRMLGIRAWWIITPLQLYNHMKAMA